MLFSVSTTHVVIAEMARVNIACAIVVLLSSCNWCVRLLRALFQFNGNQFLLLFLFGMSAVVVGLLLLLWGPIRKTIPGPPCCRVVVVVVGSNPEN